MTAGQMLVFRLRRGRGPFWGFSSSSGDALHWWGGEIWHGEVDSRLTHDKFHPHRCRWWSVGPKNCKLYEISEYKRPVGPIPCAILTNFHGFGAVPPGVNYLNMGHSLKSWEVTGYGWGLCCGAECDRTYNTYFISYSKIRIIRVRKKWHYNTLKYVWLSISLYTQFTNKYRKLVNVIVSCFQVYGKASCGL